MSERILLKKYKSHKVVEAMKITRVEIVNDDEVYARLHAENGYMAVGFEYMKHFKVAEGGYYVRYADGYESYSPEKVFEEGYSLLGDETSESTGHETLATQ